MLPSFSEALPTTMMEAAAAGRPVVATNVGGTPEVVVHGRTGLLVPPGSKAALAAAQRAHASKVLEMEERRPDSRSPEYTAYFHALVEAGDEDAIDEELETLEAENPALRQVIIKHYGFTFESNGQ